MAPTKSNLLKTASKIIKLGDQKTLKNTRIASKAEASAAQNGISQVMLRDFIHDRLYGMPGGYFTRPEHQVGMLKETIEFSQLIGYYDYR
jgi:hypothetical protein